MATTREGETRYGDDKPSGQGILTILTSQETDTLEAGKGSMIKLYAKHHTTGAPIPFWLYVTDDGFLRVVAAEPSDTNI